MQFLAEYLRSQLLLVDQWSSIFNFQTAEDVCIDHSDS